MPTIVVAGRSARRSATTASVSVRKWSLSIPRSLLLPEMRMSVGCSATALLTRPEKSAPQSLSSPAVANPAPSQARLVRFQPIDRASVAGHACAAGRPCPFIIESPIATTTGWSASDEGLLPVASPVGEHPASASIAPAIAIAIARLEREAID